MIISNFHFSTDYMPENITYALADYPHYNLLPVYGMLCLSEQEFTVEKLNMELFKRMAI